MTYFMVAIEERSFLEKLSDDYREYMNRMPRWIGIPKLEEE
jgi:protein-S-isoprenylcysteine O-methyltransferase Ste14